MRIDMDLYKEAFDLIRKGNKTVEMRLNDEKRQKIRVNDLVFFHNCENEYDVLRCKVKRIDRFKDFRTLYEHFDKEALGYRKDEKADPADMYAYYSEEMIKRYGVLAIGIEYLDDLYLTDGHMHLEYGLLNEDYVMRFVQEAAAKGLDEIDILDHSHRFKEFEGCYEHLKIYEKQKDWLAKPTKFCNTLKDYYGLIETMCKKDLPVRVRFGLEVCYTSDTKDLLKEILSDVHLDFLTGAVHSVDHILYDMSFSKELLWDVWPSEKIYRRYYEEVLSLIGSGLFDRLAHPDQIKML
ncbi:MAG: ASCH domain-containing protein, partial [Erysipelotrichaceae bacterium]|nr:ASCH domain-containing protein [Erysipelotrichaceae bacterium]